MSESIFRHASEAMLFRSVGWIAVPISANRVRVFRKIEEFDTIYILLFTPICPNQREFGFKFFNTLFELCDDRRNLGGTVSWVDML